MIPAAVVGYGGGEDMQRLAGVSRLRLVYCTINMDVFSVHRSTCKQTGASERSRVRAEIVYITVSELFWWESSQNSHFTKVGIFIFIFLRRARAWEG